MTTEDTNLSADDLSMVGGDAGKDAGTDTKAVEAPRTTERPATDGADKGADKGDPFGPDWRDRIVQGVPEDRRGKAQAWLKTRSSPYDILNAGMSADGKIQELMQSRVKIPTGKNDDPKDVEAFRKARGVPETPDKYKFDLPQDFGDLSPTDQQLKGEFLKRAHGRHWAQEDVDFAMQTHVAIIKETQAEMARAALAAQQSAVDELRNHYGREYRSNVELANRMLESELGEIGMSADERREFLSKRFSDGTAIGENVPFVKWLIKTAREKADDGALEFGETEGVDIDSKIDKIIKTRDSDVKEYERMQPELHRLIAAQNRRKARG